MGQCIVGDRSFWCHGTIGDPYTHACTSAYCGPPWLRTDVGFGCAIGIDGLLTMYMLQSTPAWIAARFVIGAGLALPWLVGDMWINSLAQEKSRSRVIAGYVACLSIGFSMGPLALDAVGINGFAPFSLGCARLAFAIAPLIPAFRFAPSVQVESGGNVMSAYSTRGRTRFHADGGQCSSVIADSIPF